MIARDLPPASWLGLPWLAKANLLVLMVFATALSALLWPAWRHNPDLSHGLFMPAIFAWLVYESRAGGPRRFLPAGSTGLPALLLCLVGLAALAFCGLYAAVLGWSHALVQFGLAASLSLFLAAGLFTFASENVRLIPFNWTAWVAVGLWPLAAPIPTGTYSKLTLSLQLWVTTTVLDTLHLFGIAAFREGNIIELATARVGVEEACSGVRSLLSCVFAAVFFSATLVRRPWSRFWLILLAAPLALLMNFLRSLALTLLANSGTDIGGAWHDDTGVAVLVTTALILGGIALWLGRLPATLPNGSASELEGSESTPGAWQGAPKTLSAALFVAACFLGFFFFNTRPAVHQDKPVPNLWALLPDGPAAPDWSVTSTPDLSSYAGVLQTDHLAERIYTHGAGSDLTKITLYLAYWLPDQAPVSQVALHTPDACWPGAGWVQQTLPTGNESVEVAGHPLPGAEGRLFTFSGSPQYVWFWHLYDGRPIAFQNPYSITQLLSIAWHYGFKHEGDQLFVRINSNRPWAEIARQPLLVEFANGLRPYGL